ncbi:MAG: DUF47 family protein [Spirochaetales bacterium]|nr:DUF47 family protein [Spirochaetales bacterium]
MKIYRSKIIEQNIDIYINLVITASLIFEEGLKSYIMENKESFANHLKDMDRIENDADKLRKGIEHRIYSKMLIPESRGDILGLLENLDNVINTSKQVIFSFDIENPAIPKALKPSIIELIEQNRKAGDSLANAVTYYFRNSELTTNETEKVFFYEHEADKLETGIKRKIFSDESLELSHKIHLRFFIEKIASFSDCCEDVAERILISTIKKEI